MNRIALKFQIGARTIFAVRRALTRIALSLDEALAGTLPALPRQDGDGYLITSLPAALVEQVDQGGRIALVRQRYTRFYADLTLGHDAWLAALSGSARATLRRKTRKAESAGMTIRAYRSVADFAAFHPLARAVSATTYQERLLDAGLPDDPAAIAHLSACAAADGLRAWLMRIDDVPIAYLCCTAQGDTLRYDHVGHDPAYGDLSPGTVLHAAAFRDLFADRFARFDFTEGAGQHKRQFATGGIACVDLLLLRPTFANGATARALSAFDGMIAQAKRAAGDPRIAALAKRVRR